MDNKFKQLNDTPPRGNESSKVSQADEKPKFKDQKIFSGKMSDDYHKGLLTTRDAQMDIRQSMAVYPRIDSTYKAKHSYNFDMIKTEVYVNREKQSELWQWVGYFFVGLLVGTTAFLMEIFENSLVNLRDKWTYKILENTDNNQMMGWLFRVGFAFNLACLASVMTIYIGPGANGSGIAEIMAILNGVKLPGFIGFKVLFIKCFCVILAIAASLCVGKEGPLAHVGAIVSQIVIHHFPIKQFKYFQNEVHKREFLCAGVSAGVSAAFASPIGGSLFAYELSKPTTFWNFSMIWRNFFCCSVSTYTVSLLNQIHHNGWSNLKISSGGTVKFGQLQNLEVQLNHIEGAFVLGIIGGSLGSLFINVNTRMTVLRKKYITKNWMRIIETGVFAVATVSTYTFFMIYMKKCIPIPANAGDEQIKQLRSWVCEEGTYNPLATLFFNTEGGTIRSLFHDDGEGNYHTEPIHLLVFISCWYIFTITTYGVWIPAGLFLPGIIMGGALGRLYTFLIQDSFHYIDGNEVQQNALLGAAAMLSGYCRMTFSLNVMLLETTQSINLFIPMLLTMLTSYCTANLFNLSLYNRALRNKQIPMLKDFVPDININLRAKVIMKEHVVSIGVIPTVEELGNALSFGYKCYPVINQKGQLVGNVSSNFLIVLIKNQAWYGKTDPTQGEDLGRVSEVSAEHQPDTSPMTKSPSGSDDYEDEMDKKISIGMDIQRLLSQKQSIKKNASTDERKQVNEDELKLMQRISRMERRGSELNQELLPMSDKLIPWTEFRSDMYSSDRSYNEVRAMVENHKYERIDVRPYMIQQPFVCMTTDKIQKVLDIYRYFQIRQLCVINPIDGSLQGVISREDLFSYMSL